MTSNSAFDTSFSGSPQLLGADFSGLEPVIGVVDETTQARLFVFNGSSGINEITFTDGPLAASVATFLTSGQMPSHSGNAPQYMFLVPDGSGDALVQYSGGSGAIVQRLSFLDAGQAVDPKETTILGTVKERLFKGGHVNLTVQTEPGFWLNFDFPLDTLPPSTGQSIRLVLRPSAMVLIPGTE